MRRSSRHFGGVTTIKQLVDFVASDPPDLRDDGTISDVRQAGRTLNTIVAGAHGIIVQAVVPAIVARFRYVEATVSGFLALDDSSLVRATTSRPVDPNATATFTDEIGQWISALEHVFLRDQYRQYRDAAMELLELESATSGRAERLVDELRGENQEASSVVPKDDPS